MCTEREIRPPKEPSHTPGEYLKNAKIAQKWIIRHHGIINCHSVLNFQCRYAGDYGFIIFGNCDFTKLPNLRLPE